MNFERAIIVRDKTRLESLTDRFNSRAQAKFYTEKAGENFAGYIEEHDNFYAELDKICEKAGKYLKTKIIDKSFLPSYIFSESDVIVVIGRDGLVANVAKYAGPIPIVGVNPDTKSYDGVLLPFDSSNFGAAIKKIIQNDFNSKRVSLAEATINDGQRLLAFNDFYIGASSHISSSYEIHLGSKTENQISSGIIISTGAGSTGWLSSIFNMAANVLGLDNTATGMKNLQWDSDELVFTVREPFRSKISDVNIGFGSIKKDQKLKIVSKMPSGGVIFSDGMVADYIEFNSGKYVEIGIAPEKALLVYPDYKKY